MIFFGRRPSSYLRRRGRRKIMVDVGRLCWLLIPFHSRPPLKQPPPPHRGIQRPMPAVERRVDVVKEVPDVAHYHAADLILGHDTVDDEAEGHQDPGKVRRGKDQQAQKAEAGFGIAPAPDVYQAGRQSGSEERKGEEW